MFLRVAWRSPRALKVEPRNKILLFYSEIKSACHTSGNKLNNIVWFSFLFQDNKKMNTEQPKTSNKIYRVKMKMQFYYDSLVEYNICLTFPAQLLLYFLIIKITFA